MFVHRCFALRSGCSGLLGRRARVRRESCRFTRANVGEIALPYAHEGAKIRRGRDVAGTRLPSIHRRVFTAAVARRRPSKFTPEPPLSRPISLRPVLLLSLPLLVRPPPSAQLSGFSAPLTTLSRKFVNVHAGSIIRSSLYRSISVARARQFAPASFRSSARDRAMPHDRSFFTLVHPRCVPPPLRRETSIDPRTRVTNSRRVPRFQVSRASGTRKRSIARYFFAPVVALEEKGDEREREKE